MGTLKMVARELEVGKDTGADWLKAMMVSYRISDRYNLAQVVNSNL